MCCTGVVRLGFESAVGEFCHGQDFALCHPAEATAAAFEREITKKPHEAAFFK
jgi:hypothetical protein